MSRAGEKHQAVEKTCPGCGKPVFRLRFGGVCGECHKAGRSGSEYLDRARAGMATAAKDPAVLQALKEKFDSPRLTVTYATVTEEELDRQEAEIMAQHDEHMWPALEAQHFENDEQAIEWIDTHDTVTGEVIEVKTFEETITPVKRKKVQDTEADIAAHGWAWVNVDNHIRDAGFRAVACGHMRDGTEHKISVQADNVTDAVAKLEKEWHALID